MYKRSGVQKVVCVKLLCVKGLCVEKVVCDTLAAEEQNMVLIVVC